MIEITLFPLFFGELFADLNLALKIFALLTIVSFVWAHLGKSPLSVALIVGFGWFVLFDYWKFFGGIFVLYTLLTLGISGILIDFFFVSQMGGEPTEAQPVSSGVDLMMRQQAMLKAKAQGANVPRGMQQRTMQQKPKRPMGR